MSYLFTYHLQNIIATNRKTTKKNTTYNEIQQIKSNVTSYQINNDNEEKDHKG